MKISVVYATITGHSKKIADYIARAIGTTAASVKDNPAMSDIDLLFIVGGIYGGQSSENLTGFAQGLDGENVKNAAIITSSLTQQKKQEALSEILRGKGINVADEIICKGSFLFFMGFSHPNKKDLEQLADNAGAIVEKIKSA